MNLFITLLLAQLLVSPMPSNPTSIMIPTSSILIPKPTRNSLRLNTFEHLITASPMRLKKNNIIAKG